MPEAPPHHVRDPLLPRAGDYLREAIAQRARPDRRTLGAARRRRLRPGARGRTSSPRSTTRAIRYVRNEANLGPRRQLERVRPARHRAAGSPCCTATTACCRTTPHACWPPPSAQPDVTALFTDAVDIDAGRRAHHARWPTSSRACSRDARTTTRWPATTTWPGCCAGNYIVCPTMCLRRELVGPAPFDASLRFVPDWEFTTRVLMEGGRAVRACATPLLEYRRHGGSETSLQTEDASRFVEEIAFLRAAGRGGRVAGWAGRRGRPAAAITVRGHLLVLRRSGPGPRPARRRPRQVAPAALRRTTRGRRRRGASGGSWSRPPGVRVDDPDPQQRQEQAGHHGLAARATRPSKAGVAERTAVGGSSRAEAAVAPPSTDETPARPGRAGR